MESAYEWVRRKRNLTWLEYGCGRNKPTDDLSVPQGVILVPSPDYQN